VGDIPATSFARIAMRKRFDALADIRNASITSTLALIETDGQAPPS
jgi:hypothetical protein